MVNEVFLSLTIPSRHSPSNQDASSYSQRDQQGPFHLLVTGCQTQSAGTEASIRISPPSRGTAPFPFLSASRLASFQPVAHLEGLRATAVKLPAGSYLPAAGQGAQPALPAAAGCSPHPASPQQDAASVCKDTDQHRPAASAAAPSPGAVRARLDGAEQPGLAGVPETAAGLEHHGL